MIGNRTKYSAINFIQSISLISLCLACLSCEKEKIQQNDSSLFVVQGLVALKDIDPTIRIELKYSTQDNFTGEKIYPFHTCLLRKETAEKLKNANLEFAGYGYRIKVWDGYRPGYAQEILWSKVADARYVADPRKGGSVHGKGGAVDLTLVDSSDKELEMPSLYDDFSSAASPLRKDLTHSVASNLNVLVSVLIKHGFSQISSEWWHFNDSDSRFYQRLEVDPRLWEGNH
ncbi:peptidase M15 [Leptospira perolatii]|uniref:D-alanyl-D-alanine dipeptidase n=1 Tax=Leptospira perolatii TaxID=2023191 RepID=A0A2M9ZT48_9LEPT|nr:M15 family metallopeptidase [Leptospira perolatii]PJZ68794.1 peptidase M15 [Leptospira perolatii]PJZ75149.1 peptidase M15 [Leptospira perolatii]